MNRLLIIIWLLTACSFCIQLAFDENSLHLKTQISSENAEKNNAMFQIKYCDDRFETLRWLRPTIAMFFLRI